MQRTDAPALNGSPALDPVSLRLTVGYTDGYKCQDWKRDTINRIARLVFSESLMERREKRHFKLRRDWRKNPCVAIYWVDRSHAKLVCQRGSRGVKRPGSKERGDPIGLDVICRNAQGKEQTISFDKAWLADTLQLEFDHSAGGIAIVRRLANGSEPVAISPSRVDIAPLFVPPGSAGFPDDWPCGCDPIMGTEYF
jgi:hypothetical protein